MTDLFSSLMILSFFQFFYFFRQLPLLSLGPLSISVSQLVCKNKALLICHESCKPYNAMLILTLKIPVRILNLCMLYFRTHSYHISGRYNVDGKNTKHLATILYF